MIGSIITANNRSPPNRTTIEAATAPLIPVRRIEHTRTLHPFMCDKHGSDSIHQSPKNKAATDDDNKELGLIWDKKERLDKTQHPHHTYGQCDSEPKYVREMTFRKAGPSGLPPLSSEHRAQSRQRPEKTRLAPSQTNTVQYFPAQTFSR